jgi:hypothetical protein
MRYRKVAVLVISYLAFTAAIMDNATTWFALERLGDAATEMNPLAAYSIEKLGLRTALLANTFWALVVVTWVGLQALNHRSKFALVFLLALALIRGYAAIHNFNGILTAL